MVIAAGSSNVVNWALQAGAREARTRCIAISPGPAPRLVCVRPATGGCYPPLAGWWLPPGQPCPQSGEVAVLDVGQYEGGAGEGADLLGLAVMCWRVRQRWLSRANPRSPRQRRDRWRALRVRLLMSSSRPPVGCLTGMRMPIPAPS